MACKGKNGCSPGRFEVVLLEQMLDRIENLEYEEDPIGFLRGYARSTRAALEAFQRSEGSDGESRADGGFADVGDE